MAKARELITDRFLERIRSDGALEKAASRVDASAKTYEPLPPMTTWSLVCEECVDTEYSDEHYDRVVAELFRRGISRGELREMRVFAWETAGWLNFEQTLWDWTSLDENDIVRALSWQLDEREIDADEHARRRAYLARYVGGVHGEARVDP
ncbi:MAG: hypothetical protein ACHREM_28200 [Polyangiales bacterium]